MRTKGPGWRGEFIATFRVLMCKQNPAHPCPVLWFLQQFPYKPPLCWLAAPPHIPAKQQLLVSGCLEAEQMPGSARSFPTAPSPAPQPRGCTEPPHPTAIWGSKSINKPPASRIPFGLNIAPGRVLIAWDPTVPRRMRRVRLGTPQLFWLQEKCDSQQQLLCIRCYPESERHQPGSPTWRHLRWFQSCVLRPRHRHRCHQRRSLPSTLPSTKPQTTAVSLHRLAGVGGVDGGDNVTASSEPWGAASHPAYSSWTSGRRSQAPGSTRSPLAALLCWVGAKVLAQRTERCRASSSGTSKVSLDVVLQPLPAWDPTAQYLIHPSLKPPISLPNSWMP